MKVLKIFAIVAVMCLAGIATCSYHFYQQYQNFPAFAEESAIQQAHAKTLNKVAVAIEQATERAIAEDNQTVDELEQQLRAALTDDETVLYAKITHHELSDTSNFADELQTTDVIKRFTITRHSSFLKGNSGYGALNGIATVILRIPVQNVDTVQSVTIYFSTPHALPD